MIRQYHAQRRLGGPNPLGVGVIAIGSLYYLQDEGFFRDRFGGGAKCRTPWMVEAFLNGVMAAATRNRRTGQWEDRFMSRRSDTAVVRSLRDGRRRTVGIHTLIVHDDLGLAKEPTAYPSLPDVARFYRTRTSAQHRQNQDKVARPTGAETRSGKGATGGGLRRLRSVRADPEPAEAAS